MINTHGITALQYIQTLQGALDLRSVEHKIKATNVANAETPNYIPKEIDPDSFENLLEAVETQDELSTATQPEIVDNPGHASVNGNQVDLEKEMMSMMENGLRYNATATYLSKHFNLMRYVIDAGR